MLGRSLFVGCLVLVVGCQTGEVAREAKGRTKSEIVNGTVSTAAQDATVLLVNGDGSCTGTLIATNLVLTARHCVATPSEGESECVGYGPTVSASSMQIFGGVNAQSGGTPDAVGKKITVPQTANMCGLDIALIQLDRELKGEKTAKVRFTELAPNEKVTAVGYGVDGQDQTPTTRMQRTTTVLGVGPKAIQYKTRDGKTVPYDLPKGDVATGESTCYGDSGGPLYDSEGRVVALTSRGIGFDDDGTHGNGCIDLPSVYAGARFNEKLIRDAATAAGHPLAEEKPPATTTPDEATGGVNKPADESTGPAPKKTKKPTESADADEKDEDSESTSDKDKDADKDEADDSKDKSKPKASSSAKNSAAPPEASTFGCSETSGRVANGRWLSVLGVVLAFGVVRRRHRQRRVS